MSTLRSRSSLLIGTWKSLWIALLLPLVVMCAEENLDGTAFSCHNQHYTRPITVSVTKNNSNILFNHCSSTSSVTISIAGGSNLTATRVVVEGLNLTVTGNSNFTAGTFLLSSPSYESPAVLLNPKAMLLQGSFFGALQIKDLVLLHNKSTVNGSASSIVRAVAAGDHRPAPLMLHNLHLTRMTEMLRVQLIQFEVSIAECSWTGSTDDNYAFLYHQATMQEASQFNMTRMQSTFGSSSAVRIEPSTAAVAATAAVIMNHVDVGAFHINIENMNNVLMSHVRARDVTLDSIVTTTGGAQGVSFEHCVLQETLEITKSTFVGTSTAPALLRFKHVAVMTKPSPQQRHTYGIVVHQSTFSSNAELVMEVVQVGAGAGGMGIRVENTPALKYEPSNLTSADRFGFHGVSFVLENIETATSGISLIGMNSLTLSSVSALTVEVLRAAMNGQNNGLRANQLVVAYSFQIGYSSFLHTTLCLERLTLMANKTSSTQNNYGLLLHQTLLKAVAVAIKKVHVVHAAASAGVRLDPSFTQTGAPSSQYTLSMEHINTTARSSIIITWASSAILRSVRGQQLVVKHLQLLSERSGSSFPPPSAASSPIAAEDLLRQYSTQPLLLLQDVHVDETLEMVNGRFRGAFIGLQRVRADAIDIQSDGSVSGSPTNYGLLIHQCEVVEGTNNSTAPSQFVVSGSTFGPAGSASMRYEVANTAPATTRQRLVVTDNTVLQGKIALWVGRVQQGDVVIHNGTILNGQLKIDNLDASQLLVGGNTTKLKDSVAITCSETTPPSNVTLVTTAVDPKATIVATSCTRTTPGGDWVLPSWVPTPFTVSITDVASCVGDGHAPTATAQPPTDTVAPPTPTPSTDDKDVTDPPVSSQPPPATNTSSSAPTPTPPPPLTSDIDTLPDTDFTLPSSLPSFVTTNTDVVPPTSVITTDGPQKPTVSTVPATDAITDVIATTAVDAPTTAAHQTPPTDEPNGTPTTQVVDQSDPPLSSPTVNDGGTTVVAPDPPQATAVDTSIEVSTATSPSTTDPGPSPPPTVVQPPPTPTPTPFDDSELGPGFVAVCGQRCHLCGITPRELTSKGNAMFAGGCSVGRCTYYDQLDYPACTDTACIDSSVCTGTKPSETSLSNVAALFYDPMPDAKDWVCQRSQDKKQEGSDSGGSTTGRVVCPDWENHVSGEFRVNGEYFDLILSESGSKQQLEEAIKGDIAKSLNIPDDKKNAQIKIKRMRSGSLIVDFEIQTAVATMSQVKQGLQSISWANSNVGTVYEEIVIVRHNKTNANLTALTLSDVQVSAAPVSSGILASPPPATQDNAPRTGDPTTSLVTVLVMGVFVAAVAVGILSFALRKTGREIGGDDVGDFDDDWSSGPSSVAEDVATPAATKKPAVARPPPNRVATSPGSDEGFASPLLQAPRMDTADGDDSIEMGTPSPLLRGSQVANSELHDGPPPPPPPSGLPPLPPKPTPTSGEGESSVSLSTASDVGSNDSSSSSDDDTL